MSKMKKFLAVLIFCLTGLLAEQSVIAKAAETKGVLQIALKESAADIWFHIYQVGTAGEKPETPAFYEKYEIAGYPQNAEEIEADIKILLSRIEEQPLESKATEADGLVEFKNLTNGIYLIVADEENSYGKITPFLVCLPGYETIAEQEYGPIYQIEAEPKTEPYKQEPVDEEPTEEPKDPEAPDDSDHPDDSEGPDDSEKPDDSDKPADSGSSGNQAGHSDTRRNNGSGTRTGDLSRIGFYLCLLVSGLFVIIGICIKKKGGGQHEDRKKTS